MAFNPIDNPVDFIVLSGQRSPGIATVEGAGSPREWQERRGFAMTGAISVYKGTKLRHFSVKFQLSTPEHFSEWAQFAELVKRPPPHTRPRAMDIEHPILEDLEIKAVSVEDVLQPVPDETGGWVYEVKFIEYRRPRLALARPDGSDETASTDSYDRQIEQLTSTLNALAAEGSP